MYVDKKILQLFLDIVIMNDMCLLCLTLYNNGINLFNSILIGILNLKIDKDLSLLPCIKQVCYKPVTNRSVARQSQVRV